MDRNEQDGEFVTKIYDLVYSYYQDTPDHSIIERFCEEVMAAVEKYTYWEAEGTYD